MNAPDQHIFQSEFSSTETALNMLTDSLLKPNGDSLTTQLTLLELSSAFDNILHETI